MAAVATGELDRVLAIGCSHGPLVVAGYNTPAETTVSGAVAAIAAVVAAGGRRLSVQGAWHSAAMAGAVAELHAALAAVPRRAGGVPLISNRDGRAAAAAEVPGRLADQLVHPVQWIACLRALAARGVTRYVVVGPGRLVRALVRATLGAVDVQIADGTRAVGSAVAA
jgi:[acyl-carrier-protein] S-malonyltransferase